MGSKFCLSICVSVLLAVFVVSGVLLMSDNDVSYPRESVYPSDTGRFPPAGAGSQALILWDGSIDFGNAVEWHDISYNAVSNGVSVQVGNSMSSMPMITSLSWVIAGLGMDSYDSLDIDISYADMPILFYYGDWSSDQGIYYAVMNENNCMPTSMHVDLGTHSVIAYRDGIPMWATDMDLVDVIYSYSIRTDGRFSPADTGVVFDIVAHGLSEDDFQTTINGFD